MKRLCKNIAPNNAFTFHPGRKTRSRGSVRWAVGIRTAGMMVFVSVLFMLFYGVASAATWGPTSITDTADDGYEAKGDSRWYASDQKG